MPVYGANPDLPDPEESAYWSQLRQDGIYDWYDLIRKYFPGLTDKAADFVLWELTDFPTATTNQIEWKLNRIKNKKARW